MTRRSSVFVLLGTCTLVAMGAHAQTPTGSADGVASSGMQQGEANVAVRSDIRMSIRGLRSTLSDRLTALNSALMGTMPAVRACYSTTVAKRPASVGGLRVVVVLASDSPAPQFEIEEVDGSDAQLTTCVRAALRQADLRVVERPAAAELILTFDNTRARGQAALEERQQEFSPDVSTEATGGSIGRWRTDGGEVEFEFRAPAAIGAETVGQLVMAVRGGFSKFLDCRRRAGRQGMNPVGDLDLALTVGRDGRIAARVTGSTVQDQKRTPGCVEKAVSAVRLDGSRTPGKATLRVSFAP